MKHRPWPEVLAVLIALGMSACGATNSSTQPSSSQEALPLHYRTYSADGLTFRYPSTWTAETYSHPAFTFNNPIVNLSNVKLHDPCVTNGSRIVCGLPISKLPPASILVMWSTVASPSVTPIVSAPDTTIAGRAGRISTAESGTCTAIGATNSVTADIARSNPDNEFEMVACLRGPGIATERQEVRTMLASASISPGY